MDLTPITMEVDNGRYFLHNNIYHKAPSQTSYIVEVNGPVTAHLANPKINFTFQVINNYQWLYFPNDITAQTTQKYDIQ